MVLAKAPQLAILFKRGLRFCSTKISLAVGTAVPHTATSTTSAHCPPPPKTCSLNVRLPTRSSFRHSLTNPPTNKLRPSALSWLATLVQNGRFLKHLTPPRLPLRLYWTPYTLECRHGQAWQETLAIGLTKRGFFREIEGKTFGYM